MADSGLCSAGRAGPPPSELLRPGEDEALLIEIVSETMARRAVKESRDRSLR